MILPYIWSGCTAPQTPVATATSCTVGSPKGMRQATITIFVIAIALIWTAASSTAADARRHRHSVKCGTDHGRVIAADTQAQLYISLNIEESLIVHGCVYGDKHSYELGYFPGDGTCSSSGCAPIVERETLAGSLVAYEYSKSGIEEFTWLVVVRDLRTGRVLHRVPTGTPRSPNPLLIGAGSTTVIVLKSDGSVAWIVEKPVKNETEYEVHALDKTGNRVLAVGTDIGPKSLALAGSTLYWTQSGQPHSTVLH